MLLDTLTSKCRSACRHVLKKRCMRQQEIQQHFGSFRYSSTVSSIRSDLPVEKLPSDVTALIQEYALRDQTPISLKDLMSVTTDINNSSNNNNTTMKSMTTSRQGQRRRLDHQQKLMNMADLLQAELPVRLAHRIQDLDSIPMLQDMPSVQKVKSIYVSSFLELLNAPKAETPQLEEEFGKLLQNLFDIHSGVLLQMARGVLEYKERYNISAYHRHELLNEEFLNRFYMSRVGIRVLAGQYLALRHQLLHDPWKKIPSNYVGMICNETSPHDVVQQAIRDASILCQLRYGEQGPPPEVTISGCLDLTFCYIPTHLHYILLELIKNSMRATMEFHRDTAIKPPVRVIIANNQDDEDNVILKVVDEGGGIPRAQMQHIWSYLFTTASPSIQKDFFEAFDKGNREGGAVLAGLGYGLPLSRAYARYFGGELDLISMEGYGTDAFCHLARLGDKASMPV